MTQFIYIEFLKQIFIFTFLTKFLEAMKRKLSLIHLNAPLMLSILFFAGIFFSCEKDDVNQVVPDEEEVLQSNEDLVKFLESTGFEGRNIVFENGQFIIDGDILISKEEVEKYAAQKAPATNEKTDHWRSYYLVNNNYVSNITVYIEGSVPSSWKTATRNAMNQWNSVNGTKLYFTETTNRNAALIRVNTSYSNQNWVARAYLPFYNGRPGDLMTINTRYNSLNSGMKLFTMVHEMGHTFGFYHTDQSQGVFIPGTPSVDSNSVMNSYVLPWNGFTNGDIDAVQIMYPQ